MKNQLLAIVAILALGSCSFNSKKNSNLSVDTLKGKVESVIIKAYEAEIEFGEFFYDPGDSELIVVRNYDASGNLLDMTVYDDERMRTADIDSKKIYKYDKGNRIVEEAEYDYDGDLTYKTEYVYEGKNLNKVVYNNGYDDNTFNHVYENNKLTEIINDSDDSISSKYFYDKKEYDKFIQDEYEYYTVYLKEGDKTLATKNPYYHTVYEYKGNNVVSYEYREENSVVKTKIEYNNKNEITHIEGAEVTPLFLLFPSSFEQMANRDFEIYDDVNSELTINYEYDKKGNWIIAKCNLDNEEYAIVTREITYR